MNTEDVLTTLFSNKKAKSLVILVEKLPEHISSLLDEAHDRYMHFIGIVSGSFNENDINSDRIKYSDMYDRSKGGECAIFDDDDCVNYMSEIYKLPKLLCKMEVINDFNWIAASGFTPDAEKDIEYASDKLEKYLSDDDLLSETIEFILNNQTAVLE